MMAHSTIQPPHHAGAPLGHRPHGSHLPHRNGHHPHGVRHPKKRHGYLLWLAALAALVMTGLVAWALAQGAAKDEAVVQLVDQMKLAADGKLGPTHHVLGGRLYAKRDGDQVTVVAGGLPQKDCVQAGWALVKRGMITINGVTPQRVSAAVLAELCAKREDDSKLEWTPKAAD